MLKWVVYKAGSGSTALTLAPDGTLYSSTAPFDSMVLAIDTHTGQERTFCSGGYDEGAQVTPTVDTENRVYTTTANDSSTGPVFSAIRADGTNVWDFVVPTHIDGMVNHYIESYLQAEPAIDPLGTVYIAGLHSVYALTNAPGQTNIYYVGTNSYSVTNVAVRWVYRTNANLGDFNLSSPVVAGDGTVFVNSYRYHNQVLSACESGVLLALDGDTGALKWSLDCGISSTLAVAPGGTLYFGCSNRFMALSPSILTTNFEYHADPLERFCLSPVIASDGTIYVASVRPFGGPLLDDRTRVYAFGPDGTIKWTNVLGHFELPYGNISWNYGLRRGCMAVASDGELYVGDLDGKFYSFRPDGSTNYIYETGTTQLKAPLIGPDGTIYIENFTAEGQSAGVILALAGTSPAACSNWPLGGRNARHASAVVSASVISPAMVSQGFQFTVVANPRVPVCACGTYDLVHWQNLGQTVTGDSGRATFVDTGITNWNYWRFYKSIPQ